MTEPVGLFGESTRPQAQDQDVRPWTAPEVEELSLEEVVDLASIQVAFTSSGCSSDVKP